MSTTLSNIQIPDHSILDLNGKQIYLGNGYVVSTGVVSISSGSSETPLMTLANPSTNASTGKQGQPISLFQFLRNFQVPSAGADCLFKFYLGPTITGAGTTLAINNLKSGSANTTLMAAKKSPTVSVTGTYLGSSYAIGAGVPSHALYILDPGSTLLVTATTSADSKTVVGELAWYEL